MGVPASESSDTASGTASDTASAAGIAAEAIDGSFVPAPGPGVGVVVVGREIVLGKVVTRSSHLQTAALNESGSIVWQCFDGSGTIDEISADIADVFHADVDAVRVDVLALAHEVGWAGFLAGVQAHLSEIEDDPAPLAVGSPFPPFEAHDERGRPFSLQQLSGRRSLLVSWSPTCGYCSRIADELGELEPGLAAAGVDLVLVAAGGARANRSSIDRSNLASRPVRLLLVDDEIDGFEGLGTPVAYLVDARGDVAEPSALGATEVVSLARRLAVRAD